MEDLKGKMKELSAEEKADLDQARITADEETVGTKKLFIESYGCAMNFADSEVVTSILRDEGYSTTSKEYEASLILLNTCSIRDNAEQKVRKRLALINARNKGRKGVKVGVLGCMAERLKTQLLEEEKIVDMVVGPDAYRDLPNLIKEVEGGQKAVNVFLSREETYADITPVRLGSNGVTAFVSIMRGCDNMCSFCVVPYTRGRERSRSASTIVAEAQDLFDKGYREVTLLGQNVDSYKWKNEAGEIETNFAQLLALVADINPLLRVRFSTSHPKDITDEVLHTIKKYENVCNYIHLPAQSGSNRILELMNRTYTREWYINRIDKIREILGEDCGISHDMIAGFCTETEEDHQETLSLMDYVKYDYGYMYYYSERPGTPAAKKFEDDVTLEIKKKRLDDIIQKQRGHALERNNLSIGTIKKVLIEGVSKRSDDFLQGRTDDNKMVIIPKDKHKKGDYVQVKITECTSATLKGIALAEELA
ncbi:tRNA (N6-isopentenyl adenosine(37)-C2)-methylthiotransferase MiaB [Arcticibacterium luteifluviistationis]|uniref:tRNA-2-methylthio-N(6)-dimethylallyladenosine synthase n=1 Tax=Arcticibacterium luteifluviistationis TaxID=1784714 RepID=A0A2Z4GBM8_9BACT|nr:tRNA (N6-isopentenyl adenosine(37)-C2)-methylthiotransferase MiaB [Arcticibacterium luteifluviistationis]AWV98692.1 tRNA (N6-isopentenyl adenosine(37)-C2)-methylthiotransferase MiaB [Arcticibacterium luteifluviistationis]